MVHLIPIHDTRVHIYESTCECGCSLSFVDGDMLLIHTREDGSTKGLIGEGEELSYNSMYWKRVDFDIFEDKIKDKGSR